MQITRNSLNTNPVAATARSVRFTPGARTAWHTHPLGQTLYVPEASAAARRRSGP
jgi:quercetin dioxygenase-like cupin family protein